MTNAIENKLAAYAQELSPTIREVDELKEEVKAFKKSDEKAVALAQSVKDAQEELKEYLKGSSIGSTLETIKELGLDLKEGFQAAVEGSEYDAKDYGSYLKARNKDEGVVKVISKGEVFSELDLEIV